MTWSEVFPEASSDEEVDVVDDEEESNEQSTEGDDLCARLAAISLPEKQSDSTVELYRQGNKHCISLREWQITVLVFQEMGWKPARPLGAYNTPLTFVPPDEATLMMHAGRALVELVRRDPGGSAFVPMDLGLLYEVTEFVAGGSSVVGHSGDAAKAEEDWATNPE